MAVFLLSKSHPVPYHSLKVFCGFVLLLRKEIKIFNKVYTSLHRLSSTYHNIFLLNHFSFQHFFVMHDLLTCWLYSLNWFSWNFKWTLLHIHKSAQLSLPQGSYSWAVLTGIIILFFTLSGVSLIYLAVISVVILPIFVWFLTNEIFY